MGKPTFDETMQTLMLRNRLERLEGELNDLSWALQFNPSPVLDALVREMTKSLEVARRQW